MATMTYFDQRAFRHDQRDFANRRVPWGGWKMPEKSSKILRRNPREKRFSFPHQRSRHAATGRIVLAVVLSVATLVIVIVSSGVNMSDADASAEIERSEERR